MLFLWTLFSNAATVRDNFFSSELQQRWNTLKLLPDWGWQVWAIGMLIILLCVAMEGAYRKWEREHRQVEILGEQLRNAEKKNSLSSDLFIVRHTEHKLGIREPNGGFGWLDPTIMPKTGTLCLQVQVLIQASSVLVENIELELIGKRLPSDWKSRKVDLYHQQYVYFNIPTWVSSGTHRVKLIAWDLDNEVNSQEFEIDIPQQS